MSSFVDREVEIAAVTKMLAGGSVVTIVGPGGLGKTRLAIEVAHRLMGSFDGVHFADLATTTAPATVLDAVCRAAGITDASGEALDALTLRLTLGQHLLVLDNCEHVIDVIAPIAEGIAQRCPGASILVTSRTLLRLDGEHRFDLGPLAVDGGAVQLLKDRAATAGAAFADTDVVVTRLCTRLDGMPLAVELAAPWLRTMSCEQLVERLDADASLLDEHRSSVDAETMTATIDWSLTRLEPQDADALCRIATFPSGLTLESLEVFLGDEADRTVARLVDVSLLRPFSAPGGRRFRILEPVRDRCLARLTRSGQATAAYRRRAEVMADMAASIAARLVSPNEVEARRRLEDELGNLAESVEWSARNAPEVAVLTVRPFVSMVSFLPAGLVRLSLPVADHTDWLSIPGGIEVAALAGMARCYLDADPAGAPLVDDVARAAAGVADLHPVVPLYLGVVATVRGDPFESVRLYQLAAERARLARSELDLAEARVLEAAWRWFSGIGDADEAVDESVAIARRLGGPSLISLTEAIHGLHLSESCMADAEPHFQRALAVAAPTGYGPGVAEFMLGIVNATSGHRAEALHFGRAALYRFVVAGLQIEVGMALAGIASMLRRLGDVHLAAQVGHIVREHYAPIAAMPGFARWLDHNGATSTVGHPTARGQAVGIVLDRLGRLVADEHNDPWARLTPTERTVAELVSDGLTNRQIAERLVVSIRTVDTHVSHVLSKLELRSRVHLATDRARRSPEDP